MIGEKSAVTKVATLSIFDFIWKYKYWILIFFSILPAIISSINLAVETKNPAYPAIELGLSVTNADSIINNDTNTLRTNPEELIGMAKPEIGVVQGLRYKWHIFLVFWKFLANLILITLPFKILYLIVKNSDDSKNYRNLGWTLGIGLVLMFILNLIIIIATVSGNTTYLSIPDGSIFSKSWFVITQTLPFHGVFNLLTYLISLMS